jgi:hypothetical protein
MFRGQLEKGEEERKKYLPLVSLAPSLYFA